MEKFSLFVVVAIACSLCVADAGFIAHLKKRLRRDAGEICRDEINECESELESRFDVDDDDVAQHLANRSWVEEFAVVAQETHACQLYVVAKPECARFSKKTEEMGFIAGYMQTPDAVDNLVALSTSPCIAEESIREQVGMEAFMCFLSYGQAMSENAERGHQLDADSACAAFGAMFQCGVSAATRTCGPATGNFLRSLAVYMLALPESEDLLTKVGEEFHVDLTACDLASLL